MNDLSSKSERAKKTVMQIFISFIDLARHKNIDSITVRELTGHAGISRGTFYSYFSDTEEVVRTIEQYLLREMPAMKDHCTRDTPKPHPEMPGRADFSSTEWERAWFLYYQKHQDPLNVLLGPHGHGQFYTRLKQQIMYELNYQMLLDGFPDDAMRKYFQSIYADVFLILAREWTQKKYHDDLELGSLCDIASTIRIGSQYRVAMELMSDGKNTDRKNADGKSTDKEEHFKESGS